MDAAQRLLARDAALFATESVMLWIAAVAFAAALVFYVMHFIRPGARVPRAASTISLLGAAGFLTIFIILRSALKGAPPFQSLYESLVWFSWTTVVAYLVIEWRRNVRIPGFFVSLVAGGGLVYAILGQSPEITPMFPALQSTWFFWHVAIAFASYAVFVVAFAVEISYLIQLGLWKIGVRADYGLTRNNIERFHRSVHQLVLFGFPMLAFGIMSGAAWANEAWGVYWQWDPKETWSLITWFAFALYLHARVRPTWRGAPATIIMIVAFACMVTTFLGVTWLARLFGIPSLHLYG
jgi:cytochrome c-type biogenesis protein CcsB